MTELPQDLARSFLSHILECDSTIDRQVLAQQNKTQTKNQQVQILGLQQHFENWFNNYLQSHNLAKSKSSQILIQLAKAFESLHYPLISGICCQIIIDHYQDRNGWKQDDYFYLAEQLESKGNHLLAVQGYRKLIELGLDKHKAYNRIGLIFMSIDQPEQAIINFKLALEEQSDYVQAQINLGVAEQFSGRYTQAIQSFLKALSKDPSQINAHYNLGISYFSIESYDLSIQSLENAIKLNPLFTDAHYNLGVVYSKLKKHRSALDCYKIVIDLNSDYLLAHYNSGVCYFELFKYEEALKCYEKVISIDPDHIRAHWNAAHCYLILGNLKKGFFEYEWRWKHNELQNKQVQRVFDAPLWLGEGSLRHKRILLHAEQGFGDTLQFIRYVNRLMGLGASLIIEVQPALKLLIQMSLLDERKKNQNEEKLIVIARGEKLPGYDLHCPLMSLPLATGRTSASFLAAAPVPYLNVDEFHQGIWSKKLDAIIQDHHLNWNLSPDEKRLRIGLVWSSGYRDDQKDTWEINQERNLQLKALETIFQLPIDWISLQIGKIPNKELQDLNLIGWQGSKLINLSAEINNFADTAAIAKCLDMVITVDTSTAHLCGALGLNTWIVLKANACWRWFLHTNQSPWYPNVRLFRQSMKGDWNGVINLLNSELKVLTTKAR